MPQVVEELRKLLAQAESGEIRAVGYAIVTRDEGISYGWQWDPNGRTRLEMHTGVTVLAHSLTADMISRV